MTMAFNNLQKRAVSAALLAFGAAVSGCASNNTNSFGIQTKSVDLLFFRSVDSKLNEDAARANVLNAALNNPHPAVSKAAREFGCKATNGVGERMREEDDWRAVSG